MHPATGERGAGRRCMWSGGACPSRRSPQGARCEAAARVGGGRGEAAQPSACCAQLIGAAQRGACSSQRIPFEAKRCLTAHFDDTLLPPASPLLTPRFHHSETCSATSDLLRQVVEAGGGGGGGLGSVVMSCSCHRPIPATRTARWEGIGEGGAVLVGGCT